MFKIFKGSLEQEYLELEKLQSEKKKILIDSVIKGISLFLILFFGYLITITLLVDDGVFPREILILSDTGMYGLALPLLFGGLFLSIFGLLISLIVKGTKEVQKKIDLVSEKISIKKLENKNYKDIIRPIEKIVLDLKYKINLTNVQQNSFENSLQKISEKIKSIIDSLSYDDLLPDEEKSTILKTIFSSQYNGNNSRIIIGQLTSKEDVFKLLYYTTLCLRKLDEVGMGEGNTTQEEDESMLLELKKLLEKRIITLNKIEKEILDQEIKEKREIKREENLNELLVDEKY